MFGGIGVIIPIGFLACVVGGLLYAFKPTRVFAFAGACGTFAFLSAAIVQFALQMFAKEANGMPDATKFNWTLAVFLICLSVGIAGGLVGTFVKHIFEKKEHHSTPGTNAPPPPKHI